ncbi:MAG: GNAT family N-acetyltransferase [Firmicutes bacterium]|nr:GNAT family N-acetyltransferase [Bacillota bacterium]
MFTYRLCTKDDQKCWIAMNREFMAEEIQDDGLWNNTGQTDDGQFAHTYAEALESGELISLLMFEEDGVPVGFANLMTIYSVWSHGKALILDDLYLRPQVRGKGYGRQALAFIEEFAKESGCRRLQFQSEVTNPNAMEFYISQGYSPADMKFYVKYFQESEK